MGGTIEVRSQRGVGTSFTIEIPIVEAKRRDDRPALPGLQAA